MPLPSIELDARIRSWSAVPVRLSAYRQLDRGKRRADPLSGAGSRPGDHHGAHGDSHDTRGGVGRGAGAETAGMNHLSRSWRWAARAAARSRPVRIWISRFCLKVRIEGNGFLLELQRQTLHTDEFLERDGFSFAAFPFGLDDIPELADKQLNSFLDMEAVFDPTGLTERFRRKIRDSYDPFEHFLHVRGYWQTQWEQAGEASERLDRFDIKNDGLRLFLGGIWTLAGKDFRRSREIYQELEDPRDLEAYEFLLRIRSWIHLRRPPGGHPDASGNHPEDVLGFEDFISFGDMLGPGAAERERFEFDNEVRARLLSARRRLASFSRGVIERELHVGRRVAPGHPIVFGASGLHHTPLGRLRHAA